MGPSGRELEVQCEKRGSCDFVRMQASHIPLCSFLPSNLFPPPNLHAVAHIWMLECLGKTVGDLFLLDNLTCFLLLFPWQLCQQQALSVRLGMWRAHTGCGTISHKPDQDSGSPESKVTGQPDGFQRIWYLRWKRPQRWETEMVALYRMVSSS